MGFPEGAQLADGARAHRHAPVLAALALADVQAHLRAVDVVEFYFHRLTHAQPAVP